MSDDAAVRLIAINDVSGPVAEATASLRAYQEATAVSSNWMAALEGRSVESAAGIRGLGDAAAHSVGSHRAAHQAMNLVSGSLVEIVGGSAAAEAGVRVLDSVMFQMAMTGGAVSLTFIGVIAAAAAVGYAFKSSAEETRKQEDALEKMRGAATSAAEQLLYLDRVQKSVAGVGAGDLTVRAMNLRQQIQELTEAMNANAEAAQKKQLTSLSGAFSATSNALSGGLLGKDATDQSAALQVKMAGNLRILTNELRNVQLEQAKLTKSSAAYNSVLADSDNPFTTYINKVNLATEQAKKLDEHIISVGDDTMAVSAMAEHLGVSYSQALQIMLQQSNILQQAWGSLAKSFGDTIGNAIMGAQDAWLVGLKSMIGAVFDAATGVVLAAAVMNQAITAALIPGTFAGILGLVVVLQAMKAVAIAALSSASSNAASSAQTATGITSGSISNGTGGSGATPASPGGTAVSSAQSQVTNNIQVNIPIQALDLASISEIQLKSLATRVGRVIAEAAGQGQFSLAGA